MRISKPKNTTFENCHFDNSISTFPNPAFVAGASIGGMENGNFISCTFNGSRCIGSSLGVQFGPGTTQDLPPKSGKNVRFISCTANDIQQIRNLQLPAPVLTTNSQALGYFIIGIKNLIFENCTAQDIVTNGPISTNGGAIGWQIQSGSDVAPEFATDNLILKGCVASRITTVNGGAAQGFGFFAVGPNTALRTVLFQDCVCEGNLALIPTLTVNPVTGAPYNNVQGTAVGFNFTRSQDGGEEFPATDINGKA